jgi:hypothetical protein
MQSRESEERALYAYLTQLGPVVPLKLGFDPEALIAALGQYECKWRLYNPRKPKFGRFGLSITSLDGGDSGIPDLDSLKEYNEANGTHFTERSFRTLTPVAGATEDFHRLLSKFEGILGRSHFIKFNAGGYFPPHRDGVILAPRALRLFAVVSNSFEAHFHFIIDNRKYFFVPGRLYFINTMLEHSFFSFEDGVTILVLNLDLTENAGELILKNLVTR